MNINYWWEEYQRWKRPWWEETAFFSRWHSLLMRIDQEGAGGSFPSFIKIPRWTSLQLDIKIITSLTQENMELLVLIMWWLYKAWSIRRLKTRSLCGNNVSTSLRRNVLTGRIVISMNGKQILACRRLSIEIIYQLTKKNTRK